MPRLPDNRCYQIVREDVDVAPIAAMLDSLSWYGVPGDPRDPNKPPCSVVLPDKFPPAVEQFIASLDLGGECARAIIRKLAPGQDIPLHVDAWMPQELDWRRFQVPIVTQPDVVMGWPSDKTWLHLSPGYVYEVRYDRPHEVTASKIGPRVHLQIDQIGATV